MTHIEQSIHATWPARRFYWARLDVSALSGHGLRRRPSFAQLSYLFETVLPLPVEELQVAFTSIHDPQSPAGSAYLACGIERSRLRAELPPGAVTLTPGDLHEVEALRTVGEVEPGVDPGVDPGIDPGALNLLHGDFEPSAVRRLRRRSMIELVAAVLVVAALITIGLQRRGQAMMADAATWRSAEAAIYEETLGPDSLHAAQPQPVQLTVELRRLRQTRRTEQSTDELAPPGGGGGGGGGVTGALVDLLRLWPVTNALTQSLSITTGRITVRAAVPDAAQAQVLIEAIEPLSGWQLQQPAIRAGREGLDLELNFAPAPRSTLAPSTVVSETQP